LELAEAVAAGAPLSLRAVKHLMTRSADEAAAWDENDRVWREIRASEDAREGPRAFAQKRPPHWTGR
jgi:crotonobetainyl-CoA hydratase